MKTQKTFFKKEERTNGDLIWNKKPIEILGDSTLKTNDDEYDIKNDFQNVFTVTTEKPLKVLSELGRVM